MTNRLPRQPRLWLDVALCEVACAVPGCMHVTQPADVLVMRDILGLPNAAEPLCPAHAADATESARQAVRVWLHCEIQRLSSFPPVDTQEPPSDPTPHASVIRRIPVEVG